MQHFNIIWKQFVEAYFFNRIYIYIYNVKLTFILYSFILKFMF